MIEFLRGWIVNIITLVMIIVLLEILVPSGKIKKFVDLVSGFILIIAIINPVIATVKKGVNLTEFQMASSNFIDKKSIEADSKILKEKQMSQITQNYRYKLIKQIEESAQGIEGIGKVKADIIINEDYNSESFGEIKRVYVTLQLKEEDQKVKPVSKIETVKIQLKEGDQKSQASAGKEVSAELKSQIEGKIQKIMDVTRDHIVITLQES